MESKILMQRDNILQVKFTLKSMSYEDENSKDLAIYRKVLLGARVMLNYNGECFLSFIRFLNRSAGQEIIRVDCPEFCITNKCFTPTDDGIWHLIDEHGSFDKGLYSFTITVTVETPVSNVVIVNSFAPLHEDEELTDFELRGEGGAVRIHKAVFAAASPVFRRMFAGAWKETAEGHVDVPETSKVTLQDLKNYMYCLLLPTTGLEPLLLLASYYNIPELEKKCVEMLVENMTAQNAYDLLKFATKNEMTRLVLAILDAVQRLKVKVEDMRVHILGTDSASV